MAGQRWATGNGVDIHFAQLAVSDQDGQAVLHLADRTDLPGLGYEPRQLSTRDCIYWPEQVPTDWDERFPGWLHAVSRCVPRPAGPPKRPAAP